MLSSPTPFWLSSSLKPLLPKPPVMHLSSAMTQLSPNLTRSLGSIWHCQLLCFLQFFPLVLWHLLFPDPPLPSHWPLPLVPAAPLRDQFLAPFCLPSWKWHLATQHRLLYGFYTVFQIYPLSPDRAPVPQAHPAKCPLGTSWVPRCVVLPSPNLLCHLCSGCRLVMHPPYSLDQKPHLHLPHVTSCQVLSSWPSYKTRLRSYFHFVPSSYRKLLWPSRVARCLSYAFMVLSTSGQYLIALATT